MKLVKYLLAVLFIFSLCSAKIQADDLSLENISQSSFLEKIPENIDLLIRENKYSLQKSEIATWFQEKNSLAYDQRYRSEIENDNFCAYIKSPVCRLSFSYIKEGKIRKTSNLKISNELVNVFTKDLARQINKDPENAKFKIEEGRVTTFSLSSPGIMLDEDKSSEIILNYILGNNYSNSIKLAFKEIKPEISNDSVNDLGIVTLIGQGKSNFKGSPKNRIYNIKVATSRFNGILIKPGEEFSFVEVLGEVDDEHGYLPELVIKKDKTEPEFGGGICQVSTTAFRAAINSGLEITARRNHAYPVSYYNPQGMDATVYVPRPDLRFINNTPAYILVETEINGTELTFNFYGTSDGRKVTITGPTILEKNPDGSMKTMFTQQVFDKNDKLIREDIFKSAYESPNKYPHPGSEPVFTEKPKDWSNSEWKDYKKAHNL